MTKKQALIVALAACVVLYRGADFWLFAAGRTSAVDLGVGFEFEGGRLAVNRVQQARLDGRPTAASAAGIRPRDVLVAFVDGRGARAPVDNLSSLGRALRALDASPGATLVFERPGAAEPGELRLSRSPGRPGLAYLALRAIPLVALPLIAVLTALLIVSLKPDDGPAFSASLLFLSFSTLFGVEFWRFPPGIREIGSVLHQLLATGFGYLLLRFFLVFPGRSALDRAWPWLKRVLLVPVALLAAGECAFTLIALYSLPVAGRLLGASGTRIILWVYGALVLGTMVLGLGVGFWELVRAPTRSDRRRLGILLGGAVAGLLPMLGAVTYVLATRRNSVSPWMAIAVLPTLPLFPMSFIYAVVRHRVLGVTLIVRKGLQYAVVSRGFLAAEGLLVFVALYFGVGPQVTQTLPDAGGGALATANAVATVFVLAGIARVNRRLKPALDRRFFRDRYNPQLVLSNLGDDLARAPADPEAIAAALATRAATALHARMAAVFLDDRLDADEQEAPGGITAPAAPHYGVRACAGADAAPAVALAGIAAHLPAAGDTEGPSRFGPRPAAVPVEPGGRFDPLWAQGVRLLVPMSGRDAILGWLVLGDKRSEEAYTQEDRGFVEDAAHQVAIALDYARLIGRVAEQEAMRRELDIAREVQEGLFPQRRPPVPTLDYFGTCRSAREVGGDYFDFLEVGPTHFGLAVADVSGKGVSAALLMSNLQAMLRSRAASEGLAIGRLVADVNRLLADSTDPSKFATLFYAVFDVPTRQLTYVNAGHNPPMLLRAGAGGLRRLAPTGMALGFAPAARYDVGEESLEAGDILVVFTDGVTEAFDESGNEYGEERLAAAVLQWRGQDARSLCESVLADVSRHVGRARQHDDVTLVVGRVL